MFSSCKLQNKLFTRAGTNLVYLRNGAVYFDHISISKLRNNKHKSKLTMKIQYEIWKSSVQIVTIPL